MSPAPSFRAFIAGATGSGKTTLAWDYYLERMPRRLLLDFTGEWESRADAVVGTVSALAGAVRRYARRGRWTIALAFDTDEMPELIDWLIPVPDLRRSPVVAVSGCVILVDEVDLIAPQGTATRPVRSLYRRSRHVGLSVVSCTQRPENVSREVSAQTTQAIALRLPEPRAQDYMGRLLGWDDSTLERWQAWTRQHPHGGYWRDLGTGLSLWLPESGPPIPGQSAEQEAAQRLSETSPLVPEEAPE